MSKGLKNFQNFFAEWKGGKRDKSTASSTVFKYCFNNFVKHELDEIILYVAELKS